jgi:hypothetical protein
MSEEAHHLVAELDSAPDDAARAALLEDRSPELLEKLHAVLWYRKFIDEVSEKGAAEERAFEAFTAQLDAATDDDARLKIIEAAHHDPQRGQEFVSEWSWRRTASTQDCLQRYLAMLGVGEVAK